jgi:hypothetical protein
MSEQKSTRTWATLAVAIGSSVILLFAACGPDEQQASVERSADLASATADPEDRYQASFVGRVEGTDALIGLTPYEGSLLAHVGNGDPADLDIGDAVGEWFDGPVENGQFDLTGGDAGRRLAGERTADGFTGTVTLADGTTHAFVAFAAEEDEGLYREWLDFGGEQAGLDIGWIRFDGLTTGAAQPASFGGPPIDDCRPGQCSVLAPSSTLSQIQGPPHPPRLCP